MGSLPKYLIWISILSIVAGVIYKVLGIDLSSIFPRYPVEPQSFLNFANVILLLSIAIAVQDIRSKKE